MTNENNIRDELLRMTSEEQFQLFQKLKEDSKNEYKRGWSERGVCDNAFPISSELCSIVDVQLTLTKREYFAGLAMKGIISNQLLYMSAVHSAEKSDDISKAVACAAVEQADALLEILSKTE